MQGYTGQSGFAGLIPAALLPDYRLFLWARLWWGFAFMFRAGDGKCLAVRRDGGGELVTGSWCEMKRLLADEWCERPVDRAAWTDDGESTRQRTQRNDGKRSEGLDCA